MSIEKLLDELRDKNPEVRHRAILRFSRSRARSIVRPCVVALKDKDSRVRSLAAEVLGNVRGRRAVQPLIASLRDPDWSVVFHAAHALGRIGDPRAITPLILAATRRGEMFESHLMVGYLSRALYAIGKRSLQPALKMLTHWHPRVRVVAAATLARLHDSRAIPSLIYALKDSDKEVRKWARAALSQFGLRAIPSLMRALRRPDLHIKGWHKEVGQTAWVLVDIGPSAVPALIAALTSSNRHARAGAAAALGELGSNRAVAALLGCLHDRNWTVRWQVATALGKLGGTEAIAPLIIALRDQHPRVREAAARAFWGLKDNRAVPALITSLKDRTPAVRSAAAGALGIIGNHRALGPLCDVLHDEAVNSKGWEGSCDPANVLADLGDRRAVKPLIAALHHHHDAIRWQAALALGKLKDRRAVEPLISILRSRDARAPKGAAIRALGELRDQRAVQPILRTSDQVRYGPGFAAEALAKIEGVKSLPFLIEALGKEETRSNAHQALQRLPVTRLAPKLVHFLDGPNSNLAWEAAELLVRARHPQAIAFLVDKLRQGSGRAADALAHVKTRRVIRHLIEALRKGTWMDATNALIQMGSAAVNPLIDAVSSPDQTGCQLAIDVLGQIGDRRAVPVLVRAMREPALRASAAEALSNITAPRSKRVLRKALDAGDLDVVAAAHRFFIADGRHGTEKTLIQALRALTRKSSYHAFGEDLAYAFVRCGNPRLVRAGRQWDRRYGGGDPANPRPEERLLASIFGEQEKYLLWKSVTKDEEP